MHIDDIFLFYFSGHGDFDPTGYYLYLYDEEYHASKFRLILNEVPQYIEGLQPNAYHKISSKKRKK